MVRDHDRMTRAVRELQNEAAVYRHLQAEGCTGVPAFYGYSEHPGLCVEKGEEDFEDVGLENLSAALKQSAVEALREVSCTVSCRESVAAVSCTVMWHYEISYGAVALPTKPS